jgi:hypothetical protein
VLASGVLDAASVRRLNAIYRRLDLVRLLRQVEALQEALWRHAVFGSRTSSPIGDLVARFELSACDGGTDEATAETIVRLRPDGTPKRKYRRTRSRWDRGCTAHARTPSKASGTRSANA